MKRKILAILMAMSLCIMGLTACGDEEESSKDPLSQEAELGIQLQNQAEDAVEQYQNQSETADDMLENTDSLGDDQDSQ
ncbi:MAG: hypothetical protein K5868_10405 [Lachnospiraceae bacterium]|nr:hypothetical protein [Lachnospiraceae bacterium]